MKNLLIFIFFLSICDLFSQELISKKDIMYGKAPDWQNNIQNLNLDLFYPAAGKNLPLIVYVHGGGFAKGTKEYITPLCKRLAENRFVVANVEYRTGFDSSADFKDEISKAVYRAEQDQLAAMRYLIHHAVEYPIDTSAVFVAGESAGGVTSLFSGYVNQNEWDAAEASLHETLGALNSSGNELTDKFKIKGVINLAGGIADTSFISEEEMRTLPVLLFHSIDDADIPFEHASHPEAKQQLLYGSRDIANRFKNNNGCYQLYFIHGAGHGYGFSSDYVSKAVSNFVSGVLTGKCSSDEIENKGDINLSYTDPDSAAEMIVDNKIVSFGPEVLQQYAGQYKGHEVVINISVEGDHLKVETAGQETHELYPVKENLFVEKQLNIQAAFTRDAGGKVIEHRVLLNQNREFVYKKIN